MYDGKPWPPPVRAYALYSTSALPLTYIVRLTGADGAETYWAVPYVLNGWLWREPYDAGYTAHLLRHRHDPAVWSVLRYTGVVGRDDESLNHYGATRPPGAEPPHA